MVNDFLENMVERNSGRLTAQTRRSFLAATGLGTTAALAGCLGGDDDEQSVRMRTATEGTTAYAGNQGIAAVVNENTDQLFVEAQTSPGTEANIGALNNEEAEMVYVQNWSAQQIADGTPPYDDLDFQMAQVFHYYDLPWFFCAVEDELESVADITADTNVSPTPEGSGTAPALETALEYATDGYNRISITYGQQASAMDEGRLDVGVGTYMNFDLVPGWLQEMMGTVDLRVLDVPDDVRADWDDDDRLLVQEFPGSDLDAAYATPEQIQAVTFAYNFVSRADLDYDLVYEFLEVLHEHRASLEDYHAVLRPLGDEDFWVDNAYDGVPFHEAAADFYQEQGLWQDEFEVADA